MILRYRCGKKVEKGVERLKEFFFYIYFLFCRDLILGYSNIYFGNTIKGKDDQQYFLLLVKKKNI